MNCGLEATLGVGKVNGSLLWVCGDPETGYKPGVESGAQRG
jgi:hypothetical protein